MPSFFDLAALETIEVLQRSAYDRTCAVLEVTSTQSTTTGEWTGGYTAKTGSLACWVNPKSADEAQQADQLNAEQTAVVKLDFVASGGVGVILPTDRIVLSTGEVFEVVDPENVQMMNRWYHVLCTREVA